MWGCTIITLFLLDMQSVIPNVEGKPRYRACVDVDKTIEKREEEANAVFTGRF